MKKEWILILAFFCLTACRSSGAEELAVVASPWPPYVDRRLEGNGLAVHLATEALRRAGYQSRVVLRSWPKDLEGTKAGVYDVIASVWFTKQRAQQITFSEPYIQCETRFVKRRDAQHEFKTLADLQGLRIGVVEGYAYRGDASPRELDVKPVFTGSVLENLRSLVAGDLDLVLADDRVAAYELNVNVDAGIRKTLILPKAYSSGGLRIGVSKQRADHAEIAERFDAAIEAMKLDGSYASILATHRASSH